MKKRIVFSVFMAVVMLATISGFALAGNGNGAPPGKHYNLNIIGHPNVLDETWDGGNGARIFVTRDARTWIYVGASDHYEILDHNGTDGMVGGGKGDPGILFPYSGIPGSGGEWKVQIYVRLVGPNSANNYTDWTSYTPGDYGLGKGTVVDPNGDTWWKYDSFRLGKSSKFSLVTNKLLCDDFAEMLWTLDKGSNFRICQMRIYLEEM